MRGAGTAKSARVLGRLILALLTSVACSALLFAPLVLDQSRLRPALAESTAIGLGIVIAGIAGLGLSRLALRCGWSDAARAMALPYALVVAIPPILVIIIGRLSGPDPHHHIPQWIEITLLPMWGAI